MGRFEDRIKVSPIIKFAAPKFSQVGHLLRWRATNSAAGLLVSLQ